MSFRELGHSWGEGVGRGNMSVEIMGLAAYSLLLQHSTTRTTSDALQVLRLISQKNGFVFTVGCQKFASLSTKLNVASD